MADNSDFKILKEKKLDKLTILKVSQNLMNGRIFVEYTSENPRIVLQKNFQDTYDGKLLVEAFSKKYKNTKELREYFGIKENK